MKREITNNQLWLIENDLTAVARQSPGIAFLLATKIQQFYSRNEVLLKILHKRVHEIQKKYIVHDDNNQPQYVAGTDNKEWFYLDSVIGKKGQLLTGEAIAAAYTEEVNEFLNRSVTVEF